MTAVGAERVCRGCRDLETLLVAQGRWEEAENIMLCCTSDPGQYEQCISTANACLECLLSFDGPVALIRHIRKEHLS